MKSEKSSQGKALALHNAQGKAKALPYIGLYMQNFAIMKQNRWLKYCLPF
jgi:hypothetical protein